MMHQQSAWTDAPAPRRGADPGALSALAYRSRAVTPPSREDLDHILRSAQSRNRAQGITGVLIYDRGNFFQWLEGPKAAINVVWDSIRHDRRHRDFKILRQQPVTQRFFKGWDMRLARTALGDIDTVLAVMAAPEELLTRLQLQPETLPGGVWDQVFADVVIPRLRVARPVRRRSDPSPWHAQSDTAFKLAEILLAMDGPHTSRYVDELVEEGAGLETLYHEVFEPAARCLGGLWEDDRCDDFNVTLAMGRLQVEAHRLGVALALPYACPAQSGHAVLLAPQPGEAHGFNAVLCSELFARDGWEVSNEFPKNNNVLREILHEQWFDVLDLSLSGALRRDQQLPAMRSTIRTARAASLNPALAVIVDGRSFFDMPEAYLDVGADAGSTTSITAVSAAERLVTALTIPRRASARG